MHNHEPHPRKRHFEPQRSCFEGATVPSDLFAAPEGHTLRVLPAPASLRVTTTAQRGHRGAFQKPWFFIQTIRPEKKHEVSAAELHARAFNAKMLNWIQLVTTPTADTPGTCLFLHFDNQRYVFGNIAEGTQRALVQRKMNLNKVENVFMSGIVNWHNAGGLIGMVLTLADTLGAARESVKAVNEGRRKKGLREVEDTTVPRLNIHGGKNLSQLLATSRRFVFRKGLPLNPHEIREDPRMTRKSNQPDWEDSNIKVWYLPVEVGNDQSARAAPKRSHNEVSTADDAPKSSREDDQKQVLEIVTQMFNSNWRLDALTETTLHKANLPAKLFIRDDKGHIQVYEGPLPGDEGEVPDIPVLVRQPWPAAMYVTLPWSEPSRQSLCYIVKNHDRRGKFNVKEAQRLGVARQDYRKLTSGENTTGTDGIIVTPEMVLEKTVTGQGFMVLDVPDLPYIEPLLNRAELADVDLQKGIVVVFWILGAGVGQDPRLQAYMQKTNHLRHVICSGDVAPNMIALESVATQNYKLHCIDPERFPLTHFNNAISLTGMPTTSLHEEYEAGRTGKMIQFAPQFIHKDDQIVPFPDVRKLAAGDQTPGIAELAEVARTKCNDPTFLEKIHKVESDIPNRDAEVISLGTGSALPSKYRNVSATLVRVPGIGNYLFDAGENTMGQLRRVFGSELPSILRDLKVIWISHLHADHHLGTASVIKAWHEETIKSNPAATLHVASHVHMIDWLREYADIEDYGYQRLTFTTFQHFDSVTKICHSQALDPQHMEASGLEKIEACLVEHCHGALATVFTWHSGLKIAYSGDCRPSDSFVQIGQGTTLLIHESTFDDELKGDAIAKKHSTMSEAIDVGRRMGARRILLTHFSQRYQKIPLLEDNLEIKVDASGEEKAKLDEVILVAFDYMRVKLGEFRKAQAYLPAIQKLFENVADP